MVPKNKKTNHLVIVGAILVKMKNFIAENAFFQGYFTKVFFDPTKRNRLSYFQNGYFFKILWWFHEPHNRVKCRSKNKSVFLDFHEWKICNTFVTFVSNKSLWEDMGHRQFIPFFSIAYIFIWNSFLFKTQKYIY